MFGKLNSIETEKILTQQITRRIICHANHGSYNGSNNYVYDGASVYA